MMIPTEPNGVIKILAPKLPTKVKSSVTIAVTGRATQSSLAIRVADAG
jgi:hypothetical protein